MGIACCGSVVTAALRRICSTSGFLEARELDEDGGDSILNSIQCGKVAGIYYFVESALLYVCQLRCD